MVERIAYAHGTPSWTDLSTSDPQAAKAFYGPLFGWEFADNPTDQGGTYVMATKNGKSVAALMQQGPEQADMGIPSMWNTYITVNDIAESVAKVEGAGGSVMMPPMDVMDAGKMAVIVDPTGAVFCMWQPVEHIGAELVNEHGALCWNEVVTPDVPTATAFYNALFGWGTQTMEMGDQGTYTVFTLGEDGIGGTPGMPQAGVPPHWSTVFAVDDCDAAVVTASQSGGTAIMEPFDTPIGRMAVISDPTGAMFQLIAMNEQPS